MINRKEQSVIQACYDWVWKLSGYLIFVTAVLQIVPGEKNRKYIHFFTGLVLIVMVATPVLKLFTSGDSFAKFQSQYDAMEVQVEEMIKSSPELAGVEESWNTDTSEYEDTEAAKITDADKHVTAGDDLEDGSNGGAEGGKVSGIRVEEVQIGHDREVP